MSTALVEIQQENVLTIFSSVNGLDPVIDEIKSLVEDFEHDLSTGAGRKRTASLANKVAKSKVYMDELGKDLVAGWKSKAKVVDAERKRMRETLDELKQVARKPLTDWEAEQAAIEAEKLAKEATEKLAAEFAADQEIALLLDEKFDREISEAKAKAEQARIDREEAMKHQAAEAARIKAEQKAAAEVARVEREKQQAIDREIQARANEAKAKQDAIDAKERAKYEAEQAEQRRILAEQKAARDKDQAWESARLAELKRQQDEAARIKREEAAREADKRHTDSVKTDAMNDFIAIGVDPANARLAVRALAAGKIRKAGINF